MYENILTTKAVDGTSGDVGRDAILVKSRRHADSLAPKQLHSPAMTARFSGGPIGLY